jgi:hypothetical protein
MIRLGELMVNRSSGEDMGIKVNGSEDTTCRIEAIQGGLIGKWNDSNPAQRVQVGDVVFEVNGVSGSSNDILQELRKDKIHWILLMSTAPTYPTEKHSLSDDGSHFPESVDEALSDAASEGTISPMSITSEFRANPHREHEIQQAEKRTRID